MAAESGDFQRDLRPILSDNCFQCHGPDSKTRMAELRLETREGAFAERKDGTPVVAGDLQASLLYQCITAKDPAWRMPPVFSKKELTSEQIDVLRHWIEQGASWDQHWSFRTLQRPDLPPVKNEQWIRNAIDRFMYDRPQDRVEPATPAALPPMPASFPRNRLGLGKWLVDDLNPLTPRVAVNRFWQEVFGTGIVKTSDDFGSQGERPSHPKLLDWLAAEFRDSDWRTGEKRDVGQQYLPDGRGILSIINRGDKAECKG